MRDEHDDFSKAARAIVSIVAQNGYITLDQLTDLVPGSELEEIDDFFDALEEHGVVLSEIEEN
ncbi:hypothetical protein JQ582_35930 [Bradyrhizobium japonicum]|uniref:hypothetical protein n=1 Tax=Bradyrhizobium japonicum TaxID=375 RepID=UPI001BA6CDBF|nr:hypothetical protein [Bradyrhizobium japonicum]MBR0749332.1 hypothetical protein [Bradyrhizobium japonicum]